MSYLELARQLAEIHKKMLRISEYQRITDSNRGEGVLLGYLARHGREATPAELSEALGVSTARIAALLNKMERKGLVERQRNPGRKNTAVKLLPDGSRLNREQEEDFCQYMVEFFERLGADRAALFVELQAEMADFMSGHQKETNSHG